MGMVRREGLGKVRHLAVSDLWIQQRVRRGDLSVAKWPGPDNPSDVGTKPVDATSMQEHLENMNFYFMSGRAVAVPQITIGAGRTC